MRPGVIKTFFERMTYEFCISPRRAYEISKRESAKKGASLFIYIGGGLNSATLDIEAKMKSFHDIFHPRRFVCLLLLLSPPFLFEIFRGSPFFSNVSQTDGGGGLKKIRELPLTNIKVKLSECNFFSFDKDRKF